MLDRVPRVYVGPNARRALTGEKGLLLGAKRPQWVDVLQFEPRTETSWNALVELRFSAFPPWEVVGLSLPSPEFHELGERLLRGLVPGDVLVTENGPSVHLGDAWTDAKLARG
jgi:hypothetical protein